MTGWPDLWPRQQKAFLSVGPKRSGKGTIAQVLTRLLGADNAVAPTLAGLGTNFRLAPLIGKRVAIISDARLGGRVDQHAIAERIPAAAGAAEAQKDLSDDFSRLLNEMDEILG
jgi:hypothetical protein